MKIKSPYHHQTPTKSPWGKRGVISPNADLGKVGRKESSVVAARRGMTKPIQCTAASRRQDLESEAVTR
jgi:hypothetical protein